MSWFQLLLCLSALCGNSQQLLLPPDPCNPTNHIELDEPHRSAHFKIGDPETPLCDNQLDEGWYRFTSQAGGTIPTTCQQNYQCGTVGPVWMNGTLPQVSEGEVERTVCVNLLSSDDHCCEKSREIKVRNCGNFYVYYLYPTPDCPVSYCAAGDITPCPADKWSPTLFPPCKDAFPIIKTPPTLPGPIIINDRSFHFVCQINFTDNDPEQRFEVSWLFDGQEDPNLPPEILSDPSREAILDGSKLAGHLNQNIECQVRSYYTRNQAHKSGYLRSNAYYAGVQASPARFVYAAQDSLKSIRLTYTVPIVCDSSYKCCLQLLVDENGSDDVVIATKCIYELCTEDWDYKNSSASVEIKIVAKTMGFIQDVSDKQLLLSFEELLPDGGPYIDIFSSISRLNDVQITLESRKSYTCSAAGGLHFTSFDGRKYNFYSLGDFTAVQVLRRNFEVQVRTWPCNLGHVPPGACICSITVREENDLVRIDQCDQVFGGRTTSPKITTPRPLQEGTIVLRSVDGKQIGVYLRSGAQIRLETAPTIFNMYITLPSIDKGSATGICGTNDGNENNEFTYPDGHVGSDCKDCSTSSDYRCCTPTDFIQAWRADTDNRPSLFMTIPDPLNMTNDTRYCSCQKDDIVCDVRGNAPVDGNACTNQCTLAPPEITDDPWAFGKRGLRYEDTDEPDVA